MSGRVLRGIFITSAILSERQRAEDIGSRRIPCDYRVYLAAVCVPLRSQESKQLRKLISKNCERYLLSIRFTFHQSFGEVGGLLQAHLGWHGWFEWIDEDFDNRR